jgi:hypothetical protein
MRMINAGLYLVVVAALMFVSVFMYLEGARIRRRMLYRLDTWEERPCWGMFLHGRDLDDEQRRRFMLKEIAQSLKSEIAFLLLSSKENPNQLNIPVGGIYAERESPGVFPNSIELDLIRNMTRQETLVIGEELQDQIPPTLRDLGVKSAIVVPLGMQDNQGYLVVCNRKAQARKKPYGLSYDRRDCETAEVFARVIAG